jgi:hypothetical protein
VTGDWPYMWREGIFGPVINIVASLCADVRFFRLALQMGALAAGFMLLLGADWSGALVRPGVAGPCGVRFGTPSHNYVGVVGGALTPWGPVLVQLARSVDLTTSHTTTTGSWEVHSDVWLGQVGAGEETSWYVTYVLSPVCVCVGGGGGG